MSFILHWFFNNKEASDPPPEFPGIMRIVNVEVKESTLVNISVVQSDAT